MANNRTKGHDGERHYGKVFRELGFIDCKTTRLMSREHDNCGIDLWGLPWNVQVKTGKHTGMKPSVILESMNEQILKRLGDGEEFQKEKFIIHRMQGKPGLVRTEYKDLVYMTVGEFMLQFPNILFNTDDTKFKQITNFPKTLSISNESNILNFYGENTILINYYNFKGDDMIVRNITENIIIFSFETFVKLLNFFDSIPSPF